MKIKAVVLTKKSRGNKVSVIAEEVGYCYSNSFSRVFKQVVGVTPNQFRKGKELEE